MTLNSWIRAATSVAHGSFASIFATDSPSEFPETSWVDSDNHRRATGASYCATLVAKPPRDAAACVAAWRTLEERTALVPAGETRLATGLAANETLFAASMDQPTFVSTSAFYLDRYAVTNDQFHEFVAAGGYNQQRLWPPEILPRVLQFVDQTGCPGPKWWSAGKPPAHKRNHPVVGISWFEADAYARWSEQRLPTAAEWQQAASWFSDGDAGELRYPWGSAFDPHRANTWHSRRGDTVPVDEYRSGSTPNGICQLIGNTWEWTADGYDGGGHQGSSRIIFEKPHAEVRGGAYDTYLETQVTSQFRTGLPLLYRGPNVGFRCRISAQDLPSPPDPSALLEIQEL